MYKDRLFTLRALRDTASYYNADKISSYIKVLVDNSFIIPSGIVKNRQMYSISEKGIEVIQELNESYSKELSLFCTQYNIIL
jgi:predicted transcriptional regulator